MPRVDNPIFDGSLVLYRRVPSEGGKTKWLNGQPILSKSNFQDSEDELSLRIANETTPENTLLGHEGFGIAYIVAGSFRQICRKDGASTILICRDEDDPAEGHVLVCGLVTDGMAKKLVKLAYWLDGYWPRFDSSQVITR
jgi:hypothetical protein